MTDYLELLLEEQEQEDAEETLGVALEENNPSPARRPVLENAAPELAAQSEVPMETRDADLASGMAASEAQWQAINAEQVQQLPATARAGGPALEQDPPAIAEQLAESEAVERISASSEQWINGMTAQWRGLAGDGTVGGWFRSDSAAAETSQRPVMAVSPQEERSAPPAQASESPTIALQATPLGADWLYRQLRTGEAAAGYARRETSPVTVVERTAAPADGGLSASALDRTLERDARRYDGGFTLF